MKTLIAAVMIFSATASLAQTKPNTETYNIDTSKTKVVWTGKKVAGPHTGEVKAKSGTLLVSGEKIASGTIVMDMKSITVTDLEPGEWNDKLVGHLKAPDFFDVEKYPEAKLLIKSSEKTANGLKINGDLTIRGKTAPVSFNATNVKKTADGYSAQAQIKVDRTKYGVVYNSAGGKSDLIKSLGDKMIYDEFTLDIDLHAKK